MNQIDIIRVDQCFVLQEMMKFQMVQEKNIQKNYSNGVTFSWIFNRCFEYSTIISRVIGWNNILKDMEIGDNVTEEA